MDDVGVGQPVFKHRFFKGCTRPAMFAGTPLIPFLLVTGVFLLLAMWTFYLVSPYVTLMLLLAYLPLLATMRHISKRDDQRLRQLLMRARMRFRHFNRGQWTATSYSPLRYKKRTT